MPGKGRFTQSGRFRHPEDGGNRPEGRLSY